MANLSQEKRGNLISRINKLKEHADEDTVLLLNEIVNELTNKKYGLVWEDHSEKVDEMMSDNIPVFTEDKSKESNRFIKKRNKNRLQYDKIYSQ